MRGVEGKGAMKRTDGCVALYMAQYFLETSTMKVPRGKKRPLVKKVNTIYANGPELLAELDHAIEKMGLKKSYGWQWAFCRWGWQVMVEDRR